MYYIALIVLLIGVVLEYKKHQTPVRFFYGAFLLLTLMLCLRYGQGTDYFNYQIMYNDTPGNFLKLFTYYGYRAEYGWRVVMWVFRLYGLPFPAMVFAISVAEMGLLYLFIQKFCKRKMLALMLCYHTLYLSWFFSILRQGLVIAIFLGLMLDWLRKKKYIPYCIACVLCGTIHGASYLLLVAPIVQTKLLNSLKWQMILAGAAWAVGIIIATGLFDDILSRVLPGAITVYLHKKGISFFAMAERLVAYCITVYLYWVSTRNNKNPDATIVMLMKVVTLGMIVYGGFLWLPLVASRMGAAFKLVEIAIWSSLCLTKDFRHKIKVAFCICLTLLMFTKNIASYIIEGTYYSERVSVWNFPYVSIFDQSAIAQYSSRK